MVQQAKKSLEDKVREEFPEFYEECQGLASGDLNNRLAQLSKDLDAVEDAKEADEGLAAAQSEATQLGAPYRDAKKALKLKTKFIIRTLKDQGAA